MTNASTATLEPPEAPELQRKVAFYHYQVIGLAFLLVPILALLGMFDKSTTHIRTESDELSMEVSYATRHRYKMITDLIVSIQNRSDQTIPLVTVKLSRDYVDQSSIVTFTPATVRITDSDYEVEIRDVAAGTSQIVRAELRGEHYGEHKGWVNAAAAGLEAVALELTTFIYP